jgi:ABC-type molybdate transport system substrate-binding protein
MSRRDGKGERVTIRTVSTRPTTGDRKMMTGRRRLAHLLLTAANGRTASSAPPHRPVGKRAKMAAQENGMKTAIRVAVASILASLFAFYLRGF